MKSRNASCANSYARGIEGGDKDTTPVTSTTQKINPKKGRMGILVSEAMETITSISHTGEILRAWHGLKIDGLVQFWKPWLELSLI